MKFIFAIVLAIGFGAPAVAQDSMTINNCTQTDVRIFFYNNRDVMMSIAKSNVDIDAQSTGQLSVAGSGQSKARVFRRQFLDEPVLIQANLNHSGTYYLSATRGEWRLTDQEDTCLLKP